MATRGSSEQCRNVSLPTDSLRYWPLRTPLWTPAAPHAFVGVFSFNHGSTSCARRDLLRALFTRWSRSSTVEVLVRFVMPTLSVNEFASDSMSIDVMFMPIPSYRRELIGKYLLQNAFFRWSLRTLPRTVTWIVRADDDAIWSPFALSWRLHALSQQAVEEPIIYGSFKVPLPHVTPFAPDLHVNALLFSMHVLCC